MRNAARGTLAAVVLSLVLVTAAHAAPAVAGGIGLRLVDIPNGGKDPRARVYIVDHLAPGAVISRRIEVSNTTAAPVHVDLYAAAASVSGGLFVPAAGHAANDASRWTSIRAAAGTIAAGGILLATVTISIARDAAPGEQYGAVFAEARSAPDASGVAQASRVGIREYLSVGPGGAPAADFTIDALTAQRSPAGAPMVVATVRNTGGRALDMSGTLQLASGPGGVRAGPFPASLGTSLAIGATEPVTIVLDAALPSGPWDAEITLASGLIERNVHATITFPDAGAAAAVKTAPTAGSSHLVALIAGVALLAAIAAGLVLLLRRRHHNDWRIANA